MSIAEMQAAADMLDSNRAVMDLPRAESNELVKAGFRLAFHARRLQALRDLNRLAIHEDLLTIVAEIDTIIQGINGSDADWQEYKAKFTQGDSDV